ncbi:hypothetical protein IscW_ISCW003260 [Ixodes scapularis]|uniref:Uncharacterized protein n=1 Tax=Ixodes scapularis TaxID=6945 RepID=B7PAP4_IXOSC|nr:hypothetical protein IscW_ISCW003260 [Ixodes scapularis]|eukprot:XP_002407094.1 hypothetical protein IscW_ISCW003260 [Ixodes scapularis]
MLDSNPHSECRSADCVRRRGRCGGVRQDSTDCNAGFNPGDTHALNLHIYMEIKQLLRTHFKPSSSIK